MIGTSQLVVMSILGIAIACGNIGFWWWVVRRGDARFCARIEQRYGVVIGRSSRGHWKVTSGTASWGRCFLIELLQLAYLLGAIVVWAVGMGLAIGVMALVHSRW